MSAALQLLEPGGFFGNYRVVKLIGKGGMSQVYLVDGPEKAQYALKLLDPAVASRRPEFVRRFVREAEFTMNARNAHLVEVYDAGQDDETHLCYLTMEYMPGGSLRNVIDHDGALSTKGAWLIARDIARGLGFIDENGLVHRDVKPDNILFTQDGRAKLTDLGITRFDRGGEDDSSRTMAGRVVGTPGYMAPEQLMDAHVVDIRADIYSLGVILYEMLVGERPNAGDSTVSSLAKALSGMTLPDVRARRPDVPERFAKLIADMTRPDPADRPASAAYLQELLEEPGLLDAPPAESPRVPTVLPAPRVPTAVPTVVPEASSDAASGDSGLRSAMAAVGIALAVLAVVIAFLLLRK